MRFLLFPLPPFKQRVSYTWCTNQVPARARCWGGGGEAIQVGCHMERIQNKRSGGSQILIRVTDMK